MSKFVYFTVPRVRLVPSREAPVIIDDYGMAVVINNFFDRNGLGGRMKKLGGDVRVVHFIGAGSASFKRCVLVYPE